MENETETGITLELLGIRLCYMLCYMVASPNSGLGASLG